MCWAAHAVPQDPYPALEGKGTEMHLQQFQHTEAPVTVTSCRINNQQEEKAQQAVTALSWKQQSTFHRMPAHPSARQSWKWLRVACVQGYQLPASRAVCWACDFSMTNFLIWYWTGLTMRYIHVLKGSLQGMETPQELSRALNTGEQPVMARASQPCLSIQSHHSLTGWHRSVQPSCPHSLQCTAPCTGLSSAPRRRAESSSSNTTPQTSFRDRQSSSCPLLQKDRIHFFCWSLKNKTCQIFQKQGREA